MGHAEWFKEQIETIDTAQFDCQLDSLSFSMGEILAAFMKKHTLTEKEMGKHLNISTAAMVSLLKGPKV
jgi:DNA-binding MarR family transcriptional regulator